MSICSASLVPTLPVNGIQLLNPALQNVNLGTDQNGYIIASGSGSSGYRGFVSAGVVLDQSKTAITGAENTTYIVIDSNNRLVHIFLNVTLSTAQLTTTSNLIYFATNPTVPLPAGNLPPINTNYPSVFPNGVSISAYFDNGNVLPSGYPMALNTIGNDTVLIVPFGYNTATYPLPADNSTLIATITYPY